MKLAVISKSGIALANNVQITEVINTPSEIIGLNEFCTGQHNDDVEEVLDGYECVTPAMENLLSVVYIVEGVNKYKCIITWEPQSTKVLVYVEDEDGNFGKMQLTGTYFVFNDEDEATKYADYQYALIRKYELMKQIGELNNELKDVMVDVTKGIKQFG